MFVPLIIAEVSDNTNEIDLIFSVCNLNILNTIPARTDIISYINKN
jgi:hypothetical protein